ncbi:MAG TPA: sensor domain-containing diguanylate cyclase [Solirubrobacteraceae bacterium]|nr:sensor domain-containing diguanylate cyclase [Solirubrobacteraceae bacterium]
MSPEERALAGKTAAVLWTCGGLTLAAFPHLPGVPQGRPVDSTILAGCAVLWGFLSLTAVDWKHTSALSLHVATTLSFAVVALAVAWTGGSHSSAWVALWMIGMFGCYFYSPPVAVGYIALCLLVQALPLFYDPHAVSDGYLAPMLGTSVGYITLGGGIALSNRRFDRLRERAEILAAEQGALQRAGSAVIGGEQPDRVFKIVAGEVARLLKATNAGVYQLTAPDELTAINTWNDLGSVGIRPGQVMTVVPGSNFDKALSGTRAVRDNSPAAGTLGGGYGYSATITAPVRVHDQVWGLLGAGTRNPLGFERADEARVEAFAQLLADIVTSLEDRARLSRQALTDQLTGLPNHRALHQRLRSELSGAARHNRPLALVMMDIDKFKQINDGGGGHAAGDEVLRQVARCLRDSARASDTVGRLGGDEFMWILPDTNADQAFEAIDRARRLINTAITDPVSVTISAGVSDTSHSVDPAELQRCADVALYASKDAGRNNVTVYDRTVTVTKSER